MTKEFCSYQGLLAKDLEKRKLYLIVKTDFRSETLALHGIRDMAKFRGVIY